jgi:hypothetical protein
VSFPETLTVDQAAFERLWSVAQAGHSQAQEALADLFAAGGRAEEARQWLGRAADAGRPSARTRLGLWEIVGFGGVQDIERGLSRIIACAGAGDAEAAHVASILHGGGVGTRRDLGEGLRWLVRSAQRGHVRAMAELGLLLGPSTGSGIQLLRTAAKSGSVVAMYALGQALRDCDEGRAWLASAADAGHPRVREIEKPRVALHAGQAGEIDWNALAEAVDLEWVYRPFDRHIERDQPRIEMLRDFLPLSICDYVIGMAAPMLKRGKVVDKQGGESVSDERSNAVMNFGLSDSDFLLELINLRIADAVDMPPENAEGLGVLHYRPGESYAPHADYIDDTPANAAQLAARGQRVRTLLVYLSEDFEGGETTFPRLNISFKPPAGSALIFHNVDAHGRIDPLTLHTGTPPTRGEKWLISKWFRNKPLRPGSSS